jgi:hypothetical protein
VCESVRRDQRAAAAHRARRLYLSTPLFSESNDDCPLITDNSLKIVEEDRIFSPLVCPSDNEKGVWTFAHMLNILRCNFEGAQIAQCCI